MKIERENGKAQLFTPYNTEFVKKIKMIGSAKWNSSKKCWEVPEEDIEIARNIMVEVYGYSDVSPNETVSVQITFLDDAIAERKPVEIFGKVVAIAYGRDSIANIGTEASLLSGNIRSGGSASHWKTIIEEGTVIVLKNVNKALFEKGAEDYKIQCDLVQNVVDKKALQEEKGRLLKRIAEIDELLKK